MIDLFVTDTTYNFIIFIIVLSLIIGTIVEFLTEYLFDTYICSEQNYSDMIILKMTLRTRILKILVISATILLCFFLSLVFLKSFDYIYWTTF